MLVIRDTEDSENGKEAHRNAEHEKNVAHNMQQEQSQGSWESPLQPWYAQSLQAKQENAIQRDPFQKQPRRVQLVGGIPGFVYPIRVERKVKGHHIETLRGRIDYVGRDERRVCV